MFFYAIFASFGANEAEKILEKKNLIIKIDNQRVFKIPKILRLFFRFLVILYAGLCLSTSSGILKASLQEIGFTKYESKGLLTDIITNKNKEEVLSNKTYMETCREFQNALGELNDKYLYRKQNSTLFVFQDEILWKNTKDNRRIILSYTVDVEMAFIQQNIRYERGGNFCLVRIGDDLIDSISVKNLLQLIEPKFDVIDERINFLEKKPDQFLPFAFSSFASQLGIHDVDFDSLDGKTKCIDTFILWFYYMVGGFIIVKFGIID